MARREQTLRTGEVFEVEYRFRAADGDVPLASRPRRPDARRRRTRSSSGSALRPTSTIARCIEEQRSASSCAAGDALARSLDYRETLGHVARARGAATSRTGAPSTSSRATAPLSEVAVAHARPGEDHLRARAAGALPAGSRLADGSRGGDSHGRGGAHPRDHRRDARARTRWTSCTSSSCVSWRFARTCACRSSRGSDECSAPSRSSRRESGRPSQRRTTCASRRSSPAAPRWRSRTRGSTARPRSAPRRRARSRRSATACSCVDTARTDPALERGGGAHHRRPRGGRARSSRVARRFRAGHAADVPGSARAGRRADEAGERPARARRPRALALDHRRSAIEDGTVYAFRDLTEERALEPMRQDLVATVSHELRTPLAAIYGAALTLRREDVDLESELRDRLLGVIAEESGPARGDRQRPAAREPARLGQAARATSSSATRSRSRSSSVDAAKRPRPRRHRRSSWTRRKRLPAVAADAGQLRQVLANLRRQRRQVLAGRRPCDAGTRRDTITTSGSRSSTAGSASRRPSGAGSSRSSTASIRT